MADCINTELTIERIEVLIDGSSFESKIREDIIARQKNIAELYEKIKQDTEEVVNIKNVVVKYLSDAKEAVGLSETALNKAKTAETNSSTALADVKDFLKKISDLKTTLEDDVTKANADLKRVKQEVNVTLQEGIKSISLLEDKVKQYADNTEKLYSDVNSINNNYLAFGTPVFRKTVASTGAKVIYNRFSRVLYGTGPDRHIYESLTDNNSSTPSPTSSTWIIADGHYLSENGGLYIGQKVSFATSRIPPQFQPLDGTTITDGVKKYPVVAVVALTSKFIEVRDNDLYFIDHTDFNRAKGSGSREVGEFQQDALQDHKHIYTGRNPAGFRHHDDTGGGMPITKKTGGVDKTSAHVADETRPRSRTVIECIYIGNPV